MQKGYELFLLCNVMVQQEGSKMVATARNPLQMLDISQQDPVVNAAAVGAKTKLEGPIPNLK